MSRRLHYRVDRLSMDLGKRKIASEAKEFPTVPVARDGEIKFYRLSCHKAMSKYCP